MKLFKSITRIALVGIVLLISQKATNAQNWSFNGTNAYYNTGKVGIGTHVPEGLLSLYQSTGSLGLSIQSGTQSRYWIGQNATDNTLHIGGTGNGLPTSGSIILNNSGLVRIPNSLRVENSADIGNYNSETNPHASWNYNLLINNNNTSLNTFSRIMFGSQGTGLGGIALYRNGNLSGDMLFQVRNGGFIETKLSILNSGNVLIGKTSQSNVSYKLDVAGKVRADEIVVNTTGADFVFEKDYKLRPLSEVEQFIQENQHLPEIPSAIEMQSEGASIGELQTKLLQKIEELTLYMIEMKKEIATLKEENQQLKTK